MSAFALKIIAMVTMFIDHLFASCIDPYGVDVWNISRHIVPGTGTTLYWIGRMIGRIAFPIFCFQIVEGSAVHKKLEALHGASGTACLNF